MRLLRLIFLLLALIPTVAIAAEAAADNVTADFYVQEAARTEARLTEEKAALALAEEQLQGLQRNRSRQKTELQGAAVNDQLVAKAELSLASARVKVENLKIEISNSEQQLATAEVAMREATDGEGQKATQEQRIFSLHSRIADLIRARIRVQKNQLSVWEQIQQLEQDWLASLRGVIGARQAVDRAADYQAVAEAILQEQTDLTHKITTYSQQAARLQNRGDTESQELRNLEYNIQEVEERSQFLSLKLSLVQLFPKMVQLHQIRDGMALGVFVSWRIGDESSDLKAELQSLQTLLQRKLQLLKERQQINQKMGKQKTLPIHIWEREAQLLTELISEYGQLDSSAQTLLNEIQDYQLALEQAYRRGLVTRYTLPSDLGEWKLLWSDLGTLPSAVSDDIQRLGNQIGAFWQQHQFSKVLLLITNEVTWLLLMFGVWRWVQRLLQPRGAPRASFSGNTALLISKLLQRNVVGIWLFGTFFWQLLMLGSGSEHFNIWLSLALGWYSFKLPLGIARLSLLENTEDIDGRDVRLYRGLRFAFAMAGVLVTVTLLAHRLQLPNDILALTDRVFMLVLLALSYPLLREWRVVPNLLAPYVGARRYLQRGIVILGLAIPLALLSNAAIGLIGYVNLAWRIGTIELQIVVFFVMTVIVWGMVGDLMDMLSRYFIRRVPNGWLWTEALLKPLHSVLHLGIIAGGLFGLVEILPRGQGSPIFQSLQQWILYPFLSIGPAKISVLSLVKLVLTLSVVIWAARWSREFAYRWLFNKARDSGVRNSLAVFTQYATVIVGAMLILAVLGIDLSTLTIVASFLAVGLGFGLRDILNNFMSGFLLLIERPMRTGDRVEVNGQEGEVTHIGMRATKIRNAQNMEVIIPNAQTINETFINLTHNDTVVGTEVSLNFNFDQDPERILNLLREALTNFPGILTSPGVDIYLREFSDSYMKFMVRYYIDMRQVASRAGKRSEVLLHIWKSLKTAHLKLAYPHQMVEMTMKNEG